MGNRNCFLDGNTDANRDIDVSRRRLGNEQLIKLIEVKMVNATAMKLFWRVSMSSSIYDGHIKLCVLVETI
jgi:hypothetical protein